MSIYLTAADEYKHISFVIIILCDLTVSTYPTDIIGKFRSLVEDHSRLSLIDWQVYETSSSAMAERPPELGNFKLVGHFEAKF